MIEKHFDKLMTKLGRKEFFSNTKEDTYLVRYIIFGKKNDSKQYRGRGLYIHKLINSEEQELFRDYPWRWGRLVIKGQFIELIRNKGGDINVKKIRRFHLSPTKSCRFAHTHRLVNEEPVWMIYWHGKYKHRWGYWINNEKIYWRDYYKTINKKVSY